jgi:cytochrome c
MTTFPRVVPAAWLSAFLLAGCAGVGLQNTQPARDVAELARPPGSIYTGWRVFQDRCARCHGADATGSASAPDLLPKVRTLGPRGFVSRVLERYDWGLPVPPPSRERLADDVMLRRLEPLEMPAWQGEPRVTAHIADLHAYLSARAEGTQGPGRPAR